MENISLVRLITIMENRDAEFEFLDFKQTNYHEGAFCAEVTCDIAFKHKETKELFIAEHEFSGDPNGSHVYEEGWDSAGFEDWDEENPEGIEVVEAEIEMIPSYKRKIK